MEGTSARSVQGANAAPAVSPAEGGVVRPPQPDRPNWTEITGAVAQAVQVVALTIAAVWTLVLYLQTREAEPRVEVVQDITSFSISTDYSLLHVNVRIKNISKVAIEPKVGLIKVQQICPLVACGGPDPLGRPCPRDAILAGKQPTIDGHPEAPWPELGYREDWLREGNMVLEPGETSMRSIDFLVPRDVTLVRVFTFVSERRDGAVGWPSEDIHKLPTPVGSKQDEVCGSNFGGRVAGERDSPTGSGTNER